MKYNGTKHDDVLIGTAGNDIFNLVQGGEDQAVGLDGDDKFLLGASLDAGDRINGGAGNDILELNGGTNITFDARTVRNIETIVLGAGHNYNITTNNATLAAGEVLTISAKALGKHDRLTLDARAETNGTYRFLAGRGIYDLSGGNANKGQNDTFIFGAHFNDSDHLNGGLGTDHLILNGDYTGGHALHLGKDALASIEVVDPKGGHSYDINAMDGAFGGNKLPVSFFCKSLEADDHFKFDDHLDSVTRDRVFAGHGTYHLKFGSNDDIFGVGSDFNRTDTLSGGNGTDTLGLNASFLTTKLDGSYTGENVLKFGNNQLHSVEILGLTGSYSYDITMADGNVSAGKTLSIEANGYSVHAGGNDSIQMAALQPRDSLIFNGAAETDGHYVFDLGQGFYKIAGGQLDDTFNVSQAFLRDRLKGGRGYDVLNLSGGGNIVVNPHALVSIEQINLAVGHNYGLTTADNTVASGKILTVDAAALNGGDSLTFNGSAETNGRFVIDSGAGADDLTGGAQRDTFAYDDGVRLSGATRDSIHAFDFSNDVIKFAAVTAIDAPVATGSISVGRFDTRLTKIFGAGQAHELGAHHAVLFTAAAGGLAGETFLIVDGDGVAGYTSGSDLVIQLDGALNIGNISMANFAA